MACFYPLTAWKSNDPADWNNGKAKMVFSVEKGLANTEVQLPCGQCIGCRLARAKAWAIRCMHEAKLHDENCFLTLTYNDENLPEGGSLNKRDFQLFMKRLRKKYGNGIRFFQCGEYGTKLQRPHHHAIIFGFNPPDLQLFSPNNGNPLYISPSINEIWGKGFVTVGSVTFDSACYVARYIMKKVNGDGADEHYKERVPEYITMSRRPGIGKLFYDKYKSDLYNYDMCVVKQGFISKPPKYYDNNLEKENPNLYQSIKKARKDAIDAIPELSYERLQALEEFQKVKSSKISRTYEGESYKY